MRKVYGQTLLASLVSDQGHSPGSLGQRLSAEATMRRIRLGGQIFALLSLLLCGFQEAGAQSPRVPRKLDGENGDPPVSAKFRARPPQPKPRGPEIFYCETPDTSCRTTQESFPIDSLRDLYVFVVWPGVTGQHVQTTEFSLPDGSIYSTKKTQFIVGGVAAFSAMTPNRNEVSPLPPAHHLMADANRIHTHGIPSLLMKSRGDSSILTVLPVGGTYITQRNLSGTWRVRVLLDDRLALESTFTLTLSSEPAKAESGAAR
jgi:hypothetical protein